MAKLKVITGILMVHLGVPRQAIRGYESCYFDTVFVDARRLKREWRRYFRAHLQHGAEHG